MSTNINNLDKFLGLKLKLLRLNKKWSLKTIAKKLEISVNEIQKYEDGLIRIPASLLYKITDTLNIPITSLLEGYNHDDRLNSEKDNIFNLLLVEDNAQDELIIRKSLEEFPKNLNITTLTDGKQVLEYFNNISQNIKYSKPELIILDLNLPDAKGLDILRDLKNKPDLKTIPVIIMTNSNNHEDIIASYNLLANGFIRKSFSFDEFKSNCLKVLHYWSNVKVCN